MHASESTVSAAAIADKRRAAPVTPGRRASGPAKRPPSATHDELADRGGRRPGTRLRVRASAACRPSPTGLDPTRPVVASLTAEFEPAAVKADPAKLTVAYAPDAAFGIDFIFKKSGEELVLTRISAWDEEP